MVRYDIITADSSSDYVQVSPPGWPHHIIVDKGGKGEM